MEMKRPSIFSITTEKDNNNFPAVDTSSPENDMISDIELLEARKILSSAMSKIQDDEDQKRRPIKDDKVKMTDLLFKLLVKRRPYFNIISKNKRMKLYRKLYVGILLVAFLYSASRSLLYVLEEPTTVQETMRPYNATFPSLTCCRKDSDKDPFITFQDVDEEVNRVFDEWVLATLTISGLGVEHQVLDLKNETILENLKTSFDQVWQVSAAMYPWKKHNPLNPCITLNVPPLDSPKQGYYEIDFRVLNPSKGQGGLYCIKHEKDQSNHNYEVDNFQKLPRGEGFQEYLIETETTSLKTSRYDCIEDNSMRFKNCIDEFIVHQLNCSLPWINNTLGQNSNLTMRYCQSEEDLAAFRNLSFSITSPYFRQQLTSKGCFRPNCKQTTWVKNPYTQNFPTQEGSSAMKMFIPATAKVIQRKEIRLADYGTFIADMGSYLGLYLGASILSLTDMVHVCFKRFSRSEIDNQNIV